LPSVSIAVTVDQSVLYSTDLIPLLWPLLIYQVSMLIEQCQLWIKKKREENKFFCERLKSISLDELIHGKMGKNSDENQS
jgi:hypothetical protein